VVGFMMIGKVMLLKLMSDKNLVALLGTNFTIFDVASKISKNFGFKHLS
jgi:hypothetical protein